MDTPKLRIGRLIGYGLLQYILLMVILFIVAMLFGSDEAAPPPLGFVIVGALMVGVSYFFARRMHFFNRNQAVIGAGVWAGITLFILLVTTIGNDTEKAIFGNWGAYFIFIGQAIGTLLIKIQPVRTQA